MFDFKIGQMVAYRNNGVTYVGQVMKKEEDATGVRVFVCFSPPQEGRGKDLPYLPFTPDQLEPVHIILNPPHHEARIRQD